MGPLRDLDDLLKEPLASAHERELSAFDRLLGEREGQLALFGVGNLGRKALACLRGSGIEPLAFSDNAPAKSRTQVDGRAHLPGDGEVLVGCVRIDDLVGKPELTFTKMDFKGAEMGELHGAVESIRRRLLLSICVDHRPNDLWRHPLLIQSLVPDYKFFLRPHDHDGWDPVCYAVPHSCLRT